MSNKWVKAPRIPLKIHTFYFMFPTTTICVKYVRTFVHSQVLEEARCEGFERVLSWEDWGGEEREVEVKTEGVGGREGGKRGRGGEGEIEAEGGMEGVDNREV